jgi:hypothetical protein
VACLHYPPPSWSIIIEEYGDLREQMRRGTSEQKKAIGYIDSVLDQLMRRARMCDMHLILIDQYPGQWSDQMLGIKYMVVYKLGPNQGAKLQTYKVNTLPDYGRFMVGEEVYDAWYAAKHIKGLLAATPPSKHPPMIVDSTAREVRSAEHGVQSEEGFATVKPADTPHSPPTWFVSPPSDDPNRWHPVVDAWFAAHPEALIGEAKGISELAKAMATSEGNVRSYTDLKGMAHTLYHEFRNAVRVGGDPLGTDITHTG